MDWYAWLSQTSLEASVIYEYSLALVRNEVEEEDIPFFNHDFLQSLGIAVAKHRLQILKLCTAKAKDKDKDKDNGLSRLLNKTRNLFARKLGFHRDRDRRLMPCHTVSGPLDLRLHQRVFYPNWSPRPRPALVSRSPTMSGPIDTLALSPKLAYDAHAVAVADRHAPHSLWSIMFQDMKPT